MTLTVAQAFQMALDLWEAANAGRKKFLRHFPRPSLGIGVFNVGPCLGLCRGEMARCLAGEMHQPGRSLSLLLCSLPLSCVGNLPYLWLGTSLLSMLNSA